MFTAAKVLRGKGLCLSKALKLYLQGVIYGLKAVYQRLTSDVKIFFGSKIWNFYDLQEKGVKYIDN